jgi:hypothetical protein
LSISIRWQQKQRVLSAFTTKAIRETKTITQTTNIVGSRHVRYLSSLHFYTENEKPVKGKVKKETTIISRM